LTGMMTHVLASRGIVAFAIPHIASGTNVRIAKAQALARKPENYPAGRIRVIVVRIISPQNGKPNWEGVSSEERERIPNSPPR
jgi:hypothetical protein